MQKPFNGFGLQPIWFSYFKYWKIIIIGQMNDKLNCWVTTAVQGADSGAVWCKLLDSTLKILVRLLKNIGWTFNEGVHHHIPENVLRDLGCLQKEKSFIFPNSSSWERSSSAVLQGRRSKALKRTQILFKLRLPVGQIRVKSLSTREATAEGTRPCFVWGRALSRIVAKMFSSLSRRPLGGGWTRRWLFR